MNKQNIILGLVLAAQVIIVTSLSFQKNEGVKKSISLAEGLGEISSIQIKSEGGQQVELLKSSSGWTQKEYFNTPANTELVDKVLEALTQSISVLPVGTTSIAAKNFETSPEKYKKKITLSDSKKEKTVFMGKSPIFKSTYFSSGGSDETYLLPISSYEFSNKPEDWLEKDFLSVSKESIDSLVIACGAKDQSAVPIKLVKGDDGFFVEDLPENREIIKSEVDKVLSKISLLYVDSVMSLVEGDAKIDSEDEAISCSVEIKGEEDLSLKIVKIGKKALVKSSKWESLYGSTSELNVKAIIEAGLASLSKEVEATQEESESTVQNKSEEGAAAAE